MLLHEEIPDLNFDSMISSV